MVPLKLNTPVSVAEEYPWYLIERGVVFLHFHIQFTFSVEEKEQGNAIKHHTIQPHFYFFKEKYSC